MDSQKPFGESRKPGSSSPGTGRKRLQQRLRDTERVFLTLFAYNPNAIGVFTVDGCLIQSNPRASELTGCSEKELIGRTFASFLAPDQLVFGFHDISPDGTPKSFETAILHRDGFRIDVTVTCVPILDGRRITGFILICQDISERKRTESRIRHMAYYDEMTGLPNRRYFKEKLNEMLDCGEDERKNIGVFFIDIDHYKLVNDSFGHDYGNMLMLQVADRLSRCLSNGDFLARTEGDEFAFGYSRIHDSGGLASRADLIAGMLEQPFIVGEESLHLSASIGIALHTGMEEDAETLMKHAAIALSHAKGKPKNTYQVFNQAMKNVSARRLKTESELRRALQNNEFELYYQPQMEISSGRVIGMEALIRWIHPVRGIVPPREFIPVAEECGLIVPIGEWVIMEACRQNKKWQQNGLLTVPVSVNLSVRQFLQPNLPGKVAAILEQTGLAPEYLDLEITESMTMDVEFATNCLLELKQLGIQISIDDFGTGYSSLSYLKKFPIDKLKIDYTFVRDIMSDPNDAAIVTTIISMAHNLQLQVIAEGVETKEQLTFLYRNRCNHIQGYLFSPPVNAAQIEELLLEQAGSVL